MAVVKVLSLLACALLAETAALPAPHESKFIVEATELEEDDDMRFNQDNVLSRMDKTATPCSDFFQFACGGWMKNNPIPSDKGKWGVLGKMGESNLKKLEKMLAQTDGEETKAVLERTDADDMTRAKIMYASCMDEKAMEEKGIEPLKPVLAKIAKVDDIDSLFSYLAERHAEGHGELFGWGVGADAKAPDNNILEWAQSGLGLPERDYYTKSGEKDKKLRQQYLEHMQRMLELVGSKCKGSDAAKVVKAVDSKEVMSFETKLAEISVDKVTRRDPHKTYNPTDEEGFKKLSSDLPWNSYIASLKKLRPKKSKSKELGKINVEWPGYFKKLQTLVQESDMATMRQYLTWHAVSSATGKLSKDIREANFEFEGKVLGGLKQMPPRWKTCVRSVSGSLRDAVGKLYVQQYFDSKSKASADDLIIRVEKAFKQRLPDLEWMDSKGRVAAEGKAKQVGNMIGFPADTKWKRYPFTVKAGDLFGNLKNANIHAVEEELEKLDKPVDRDEWHMGPQDVNAYYSPSSNRIVFPAAILQPPMFDKDAPAAANYGAIGMVIGHELTHGFDDQGRKFDGSGKMQDWWSKDMVDKFEKRASKVKELYKRFEVEPGLNVNGDLTVGENMADMGGLKLAFQAWKELEKEKHSLGKKNSGIEGLDKEQLFFVAAAQAWCGHSTPESVRMQVNTDPHSPERFRINGPMSQMEQFAKTFKCKAGDKMTATEKVTVW